MTLREIGIALVLLAVALAGAFSIRSAGASSGWRRRSVRVFGVFLIVVAAFAALSWWARSGSRMPAPVFAVGSPNGAFLARVVEPEGDLIPTHFVRISVRRAGRFLAAEVYVGEVEPNIHWVSEQTLELIYPDQERKPYCGRGWSRIDVICKEVRKVDFKPNLRI